MSKVVGMLSSLGATSFEKNKPFSPEDLEVVKIKDRFYERNTMFHKTIKTIKVQTKFSDEIKYETVDYHFLGPVNGVSYNGVISEIFKLFQDYYFILDYINCYHVILPIGLITVPEPINLCLLTKINNNDFFISQKNIFLLSAPRRCPCCMCPRILSAPWSVKFRIIAKKAWKSSRARWILFLPKTG